MDINDEENPRLITFAECQTRYGNGRYIDLGVISAADVYAAGYIELLPAVVGRIITGVRFLLDNFDNSDGQSQLLFTSGNDISLNNGTGFGSFGQDTKDSRGISTDVVMGDNGPLGVVSSQVGGAPGRILQWTANTKYAQGDFVIGNGHAQACGITTGSGGTSGSSEPTWDILGGTTNDGTIVWQDSGDSMSGWTATVHAIAEVVFIPGLDIPRPVTLEFLQQPTDVVAGEQFDPEVAVRVLDQNGDLFTLQAIQADMFVLGEGMLTGGNGVQTGSENGIATWSGNLSMDVATTPGTYQLIVMIRDTFRSTYFRLASDPFDVTAP